MGQEQKGLWAGHEEQGRWEEMHLEWQAGPDRGLASVFFYVDGTATEGFPEGTHVLL